MSQPWWFLSRVTLTGMWLRAIQTLVKTTLYYPRTTLSRGDGNIVVPLHSNSSLLKGDPFFASNSELFDPTHLRIEDQTYTPSTSKKPTINSTVTPGPIPSLNTSTIQPSSPTLTSPSNQTSKATPPQTASQSSSLENSKSSKSGETLQYGLLILMAIALTL